MKKHFYLVANGRFHVWLPLEGKGKNMFFTSFSPPSTFHPKRFYLNFFSIDFKVLFYHGPRPLLHIFLPFTWSINCTHASWCTKSSTHSSSSWFWSKIFFSFFEFIVSRMTMFYKLQVAQVNEKSPQESSLNLTLT